MNIRIAFEADNAAFADEPGIEVARILNDLADKFDGAGASRLTEWHGSGVYDINGNRVGGVHIGEGVQI